MSLSIWWSFWTSDIFIYFLQPRIYLSPEDEDFLPTSSNHSSLLLVCSSSRHIWILHALQQLTWGCHWTLIEKQILYTTIFSQKSGIQSLPLNFNVRQFVFYSFPFSFSHFVLYQSYFGCFTLYCFVSTGLLFVDIPLYIFGIISKVFLMHSI